MVPSLLIQKLDFSSVAVRPGYRFFAPVAGALIGFVNDLLDIHPSANVVYGFVGLLFVMLISSFIGCFGIVAIGIPGDGTLYLGVIVPYIVS